jgi:hypothetical protein
MTVPAFPRPFPSALSTGAKFIEANFILTRRQAVGVLESGRDVTIDRGRPQWKASWQTPKLAPGDLGIWRAWGDSLQSSARTFLGFDPAREFPLAYMPQGPSAMVRAGTSTAFDGTFSLAGIGTFRNEIALSGLPVGLPLALGDYISAIQSGKYSLHRVSEAVTATAQGVIGSVYIEPELPNGYTVAGAILNIYRPCAKFKLIAPLSIPVAGSGGYRQGAAQFEALSVMT